jgi:hypothetical protein
MPVVHCILPNKEKKTYIRLFSCIKSKIGEFESKYVVFDLETAAINAFKKAFVATEIFICLFHLGQIFYGQIKL